MIFVDALIQYSRAVCADAPTAGTVRLEIMTHMEQKDTLKMAQTAIGVKSNTVASQAQ